MSTGRAIATAICFIWLGMVLGISFIETPLKFRAPGVDLKIGLGIGRLVFRALNTVELGLAVVLLCVVSPSSAGRGLKVAAVLPVAVLALQLALVRPALTRRSDRVLAGSDDSRSRAHLGYVAAETAKVVALIAAGVVALHR